MFKLITCIAAEDKAQETVSRLDADYKIQALVSYFARGLGRSSTTPSVQGLGQQTEKTIFSVLVPISQVDEMFEFIYHTAGLHRPHGGIIYITPIKQGLISPIINPSSLTATPSMENPIAK